MVRASCNGCSTSFTLELENNERDQEWVGYTWERLSITMEDFTLIQEDGTIEYRLIEYSGWGYKGAGSFTIETSPNVTDGDGDGYDTTVDCDDTDAAINPGATEACNGIDDNCDGSIDEGLDTTDADGDTFPACNDCDGNHGAQPPGVTSVANVCGHCHTFNADLFNQSAHKAAFDARGLPECVTCHGYHDTVHPTDEMVGTGPESVCIRCHKPGDKGYQMAHQIYTLLSELSTKHEEARAVVKQAEQKGMEVSDSQFVFNDVLQIVIKAQTLTHSLDFPQIESTVEEGLALVTKAREIGEDSLEEFHYRRRWFSISLGLMLFVLIFLYFKIRTLHH